MKLRAFLLATSLLYAVPALALVDPPAAGKADGHVRSVVYDPNNPVQIFAVPGASLRIELGADETVTTIVVSDQGTVAPDVTEPPDGASAGLAGGLSSGPKTPASCDPNLCRSVAGNFVYLKPLHPLDPQPLFIQTERTDEYGKPQMVPYTFELLTRAADLPGQSAKSVAMVNDSNAPPAQPTPLPTPVWSVRFVYPDRVKAAATAAWLRHKRAADDAAREAASMVRATAAVPGPSANWRYGYRGAASVQPDQVWDDGRTTFLRYNGNRRVPNIYSHLPDGHESIPAVASEPDGTGNTLRIARTETKWWIRDGDEAGCLFDLGPDPDGRSAATVSETVPATKAASR
jgi:type IV secretion system protein VirB9